MNSIQQQILDAFTTLALNNSRYFAALFTQRLVDTGGTAGSFFDDKEMSVKKLVDAAKDAVIFDPERGLGIPGCTYIEIPNIGGTLGIVDLAILPQEAVVQLLDPKGTCGTEGGGVDAYYEVDGVQAHVNHAVIILGDDEGQRVPWTFFPGDRHSLTPRPTLANDPKLVGLTVTITEARKIGLTVAKLVIKK